ncbi:hypothetical protein SAMN05421820_101477 [Pedobacter steynii]|uniref:DUF3945 domain-containing protein n=1 Tax=Pedobacter steynii TaxID=430522 RepID=A0A1G9K730_9SPHI|nr:hypothetical protein [Pedobacter steynii]NQX38456.1 hypothetical protein [Pedobacter steynii]SDL45063.1 hypothetical protein SAMN05421820_101477 [Pedobacter steynii]
METEQNRAKVLWQNWEKLENELRQLGGKTGEQDAEIARQKYEYLRKGLYRLSERPVDTEKPYVAMISSVTSKLQKQLYPNRFLRLLHQAKALLYDKPKVFSDLQQLRAQNISTLKGIFEQRGLDSIAKVLDHYLEYGQQNVSFKVLGKMDDNRILGIAPVFQQDEKGLFMFSDLNLSLRGSADPANNVSVSLPGDYLLNREQLVNFVEQRPVYVFPSAELDAGKWIRLGRGEKGEELKLEVFDDKGDELKRKLYELAEETKLYKLSSSEVLLNLRQGNQFRMNGIHPADRRFFIEAHPRGNQLIIRNEFGEEITKDMLLKSLRHESPNLTKGFELIKNKVIEKDRSNSPDQGLSM